MSADPSKTKFSTSIIAITGLIGAVAGLLTVLHTTGVIDLTKDKIAEQEKHEKIPEKRNKPELVEEIEPKKVNNERTQIQRNVVGTYEEEDFYEPPSNHNLTGYWYENAQGSRYYFNHDAYGNIGFQEYGVNEYGVTIVTAEGTGTVQNKNLSVTFLSYLGYAGTFQGKIENNGNTINGVASVPATGQTMRIIMNRE